MRNGTSIDTIGQALADAMNEANEAFHAEQEAAKAEQAAQDLAQHKRNLACELIDIIRDYGDLVAPDAADMLDELDDDDIDMMVNTLDEMFKMMTAVSELKVALKPATKKTHSDDEVLANFIKSLM